jgi:predicted permease
MRPLIARLLALFRRRQLDDELSDEMSAHLEMSTADYVDRGMSLADARRAARLRFGGTLQTAEAYRDRQGFPLLESLWQDMRYAVRTLRRTPLFVVTVAATIGLGLGLSGSAFTILNAYLLKPIDLPNPHALYALSWDTEITRRHRFRLADYEALQPEARRFTGLAAAQDVTVMQDSVSTRGVLVTGNYFDVLGAAPAVGRLFDAEIDRGGSDPVVVLSHRFWVRRFNKDPDVVGRTVTLNRQPFTVVGVASEGFHGSGVRAGDVWLPMTTAATSGTLTNRASAFLLVSGRLKPGVSVPQAAVEMGAIGLALEFEYPDQNRGRTFIVESSSLVPGAKVPVAVFLALVAAIVTLVLVIACANLAGVLLARAAARRQEIAVRLAMGAGRARLVRQLLAETLMLFSLGGAAGLMIARGLTSMLVSFLPALPFPVDVSLALDVRAVLFTAALALVTALFSGLAPALSESMVSRSYASA